jgi:plastocyanin
MEETPTPEETATECQDLTTEEEVELQMSDNVFSPACIVSLGGQKVELENEGLNRHNFSIEGTKVDIDVEPDANASPGLVAELAEPGTHQFFCKYHRSLGMEGEITIVEAG